MKPAYNECPECGRDKWITAKLCRDCFENPDPIQRILARVEEGEGGCLLYHGSLNHGGYGLVLIGGRAGRHHRAHRIMYEAFVGPIPAGLQLDHLCRVRHCVNPAHLEPVTIAENVRRGAAAQTHCKRGHEFTPKNTVVHHGGRECRTCNRLLARRRYHAKKEAA